jgi:hypothetical protein
MCECLHFIFEVFLVIENLRNKRVFNYWKVFTKCVLYEYVVIILEEQFLYELLRYET